MLTIIEHDLTTEIRLQRAPVNAINPELVIQLTQVLQEIYNGSQRSIIISGRDGMFSAGLDVPELVQLDREAMAAFWSGFSGLLQTLATAPIPIVAAISGHSPAGGAVLSLYCDYRIMVSEDYKIGLNETRVGLVVPQIIQQALRRLVGNHQAERLLVAGSLLSPQQAHQVGLVDQLADSYESLINAAKAWCQQHIELPQKAMSITRRMARADLVALFEDFDNLCTEPFINHWFDPDTQDALHNLVAQLKKK